MLFFGALFFFTCLTPEAYCIQVRGLNISQITDPQNDSRKHATSSDNDRIDKMLEGYKFLTSSINPKVEIKFPENDHDNTQVRDSSLTDTDAESIDAESASKVLGQIKQSFPTRFALNSSPNQVGSKNYYLQKDEISDHKAQGSFTRDLCSKLAKDASRIANAHKHARTRDSTTCLCVVLRDKKENAKKFVFHNGPEAMHKSMNDKAVDLNYATRTGYQAHAEMEFIEFLLHRQKQNEERYTHILGMGCSRQHCKECDCLLQLFLGSNYHEFTVAMQKEESPESGVGMPTIEELSQDEGDGVKMTVPEESQVFKVVYKEEAVQDKLYSQYRLSEDRQQETQGKASLPDLDFSDGRFKIKDNVMERSDKKRKRQDGS